MARDRMFHVLVAGGIALVASNACGSSTVVTSDAGAHDEGGFPSELPAEVDASSQVDAGLDTGFPSELPTISPDAAPDTGGTDAADAATDGACFPCEAPT